MGEDEALPVALRPASTWNYLTRWVPQDRECEGTQVLVFPSDLGSLLGHSRPCGIWGERDLSSKPRFATYYSCKDGDLA